MKKHVLLYIFSIFLALFGLYQIKMTVFAEQSGSSPESGSTSRIQEAYDWLVNKGANYGATDATDWDSSSTYAWGTYWNRIMEAAAWEPDGTGTAAEIPTGLTFYAGNGDRTQKTGTLYQNWELQDYDDLNCSGNNGEGVAACGTEDSEYTGEEGTWTLKSNPGGANCVTDTDPEPDAQVCLSSNKVYMDNRTRLYWTDRTAQQVDNEFVFIDGDSRSSPAGNSCNFNATGNANAYCDNQDPLNAFPGAGDNPPAEDNDVSAAEFCLNLSLEAGDGDDDPETDWRLPTQKELMLAYINGASNNLPNPSSSFWSSTEYYGSQSYAWYVYLGYGYSNGTTKSSSSYYAACVRRDN